MQRFFSAFLFVGLLSALVLPKTANAQSALGTLTGNVLSADGSPLMDATIRLEGQTRITISSGVSGAFRIPAVLPGIYSLVVQKPSFESVTRTNVVVGPGEDVAVSIVLPASSFSQHNVIGSTSTASRQASINTSAAAIASIPATTFADQGTPQVTQVLNETPGIVTTMAPSGFPNGASMTPAQIPQIRGALPYETQSLIDGHPVSVGATGYFTPLYIDTHLLQGVDIIKGPGAMPVDINYAIGGSIDYRTLEPTRKAQQSIEMALDSYGGLSAYGKATGTAGRLGYVAAFGFDGTPGPMNNYQVIGAPGFLADGLTPYINGIPMCGAGNGASCLFGIGPGSPNVYNDFSLDFPLIASGGISTASFIRTELAKARYSFSQQTSITVTYLGGQSVQDSPNSYAWNNLFFTPAAGYAGSVPAGSTLPFGADPYQSYMQWTQQALLHGELRTSIGSASVLLRYYTGVNNSNLGTPFGQTYIFSAPTWGSLPIGPGGSSVFFNGQGESYSVTGIGLADIETDHVNGLSGEVDLPVGNGLYSLSYDRSAHNSFAGNFYEIPGQNSITIPNGSSQALTTYLVKGQWSLTPKLDATLGNYFISYLTHYTADGGTTFQDAIHNFYGPRFGLSFRPDPDTAVRVSLGSSIAPPYLALVTTNGGAPQPNDLGAVNYYTETVNNGKISPETAFGYDLGMDRRFGSDTVLSGDIYLTTLHGQFLTSTTQNGTYTATSGPNAGITAPLFVSQAENLADSRMEGIELTLAKTPVGGFGYRVQGDLMRAYTYNLPPGFYNTPGGVDTTNVAVLPYVNFPPTGFNFNGIGIGRIPYSTGYAELNVRSRSFFALLGVTYYGPDNSYNQPAFGVVNASIRWQFDKRTYLQLSGYNLTAAYNEPYALFNGGVAVPLINGMVGAVSAINVGPTKCLLILRHNFGQ